MGGAGSIEECAAAAADVGVDSCGATWGVAGAGGRLLPDTTTIFFAPIVDGGVERAL